MDIPLTSDIQVLDETSTRRDLARRCEVKYAFTDVDCGKLRSHLAGNCRRIIHNKPVSVVRSIYFDDARFSSCQDNLNGVGSRRKLRLRWYDSLAPQQLVYLEIKWREGKVTGKHRLKLKFPMPVAELPYAALFNSLEGVVPEHFLLALLKASEPAILIQYDREHFISHDGDIRLTLDSNLTFYDQVGRQRVNTQFPARLPDLTVIEGKVPVGREAELRGILAPFVPRANRCSKYVNGLRLLGHISED